MKISEEICQILQEATRSKEEVKKFVDSLKSGDTLRCIERCPRFKKGDIVTFKGVSRDLITVETGSAHTRYEAKTSPYYFEKA